VYVCMALEIELELDILPLLGIKSCF